LQLTVNKIRKLIPAYRLPLKDKTHHRYRQGNCNSSKCIEMAEPFPIRLRDRNSYNSSPALIVLSLCIESRQEGTEQFTNNRSCKMRIVGEATESRGSPLFEHQQWREYQQRRKTFPDR
jgi:hypothetical protein